MKFIKITLIFVLLFLLVGQCFSDEQGWKKPSSSSSSTWQIDSQTSGTWQTGSQTTGTWNSSTSSNNYSQLPDYEDSDTQDSDDDSDTDDIAQLPDFGDIPDTDDPNEGNTDDPNGRNYYYLDAVNGSDNNEGTRSNPWKTLSKAQSTISDGDIVILRSGNYGNFVNNNIAHTEWTTYQADTGETPIFSQMGIYNEGIRVYSNKGAIEANLIFRGITVYHTGALVRGAINVMFDDCTFTGPGYSIKTPYANDRTNYGIQLHGTSGITIKNCIISGNGTSFDDYIGHYTAFVATTNGSPIVTGIGTTWTQAAVGETFCCDENGYTILSVQSNTQLTLTTNFTGTTSLKRNYAITGDEYEGTVGGIQGSEGGYGKGYNYGIVFESPCQNVTITNCDIGGCDTAIGGVSNSGIIISNNDIHHTTTDFITIQGTNPASSELNAPVRIEYNHIHDGIEAFYGRIGSDGLPILNDFAHNDAIQGNGGSGESFELNHLIIRGNHIHHQDGDAMFIRGSMVAPYGNTDWLVENNLVYDTLLRYQDAATTINATFYNCDDCTFRNNTILCGKTSGQRDDTSVSPMIFTTFKNNIISLLNFNAIEGSQCGTIVKYENANIINSIQYGTHQFNFSSNTTLFNPYRTNPVSYSQFKALFTDYNNQYYTLAVGSMAIEHSDLSNYPATDITGTLRGDNPDAGCFEYESSFNDIYRNIGYNDNTLNE